MGAANSVLLGYAQGGEPVYLPPKVRQTHMHIIGGTGKGKSKLIESMIRQDILSGQGLCLIDPHGQLCDDVLAWCQAKKIAKTRSVLLFEPAEEDWAFAFNPLKVDSGQLSYHVDFMVKAFAKVWGGENTDQTPLFERCITAILWLLAEQGRPLIDARYLIDRTDPTVRRYLAEKLQNPDIRREWDYFNTLKPRPFNDEFGSTINRMARFLRSPTIKSIIGQVEDAIDFRRVMDEGAVLLVNLGTKGNLSREEARLLGTLMVNDLFMKALDRQAGCRPFYLYIDECARFLNDDIHYILDETRKFGLHLILAHQRLGQLREAGENIYNAVMSIESKAILGGIFKDDAQELAQQVFLGELNLEEAKASLRKPAVVGYDRERLASHSRSVGQSQGSSFSWGAGRSESASESRSVAYQYPGEGAFAPVGTSTARSRGASYLRSSSESYGQSEATSESESWGWAEALVPRLEWLPGSVFSLEEQVYKATASMVNQPPQRAIVKLGSCATKFIKTLDVPPAVAKEEWKRQFKEQCYRLARPAFVKPRTLVQAQMDARLLALEEEARQAMAGDEEPVEASEFWE